MPGTQVTGSRSPRGGPGTDRRGDRVRGLGRVRSSEAMWASTSALDAAIPRQARRSDSAPSISPSWRRPATSSPRRWACSVGRDRGGRTAPANWVVTRASSVSVLASMPVAREVAHLAGIDDRNREAGGGQRGRERAPRSRRWLRGRGGSASGRAAGPSEGGQAGPVWGTSNASPAGGTWTSRRSFATSRPTKRWSMPRPCKCGLLKPERLCGFTVRDGGAGPDAFRHGLRETKETTGSRPPPLSRPILLDGSGLRDTRATGNHPAMRPLG